MRKVGATMLMLGFMMLACYYIYYSQKKVNENNNIEEYIETTSKQDTEEVVDIKEEPKEEVKQTYQTTYKAILEIPSISLKKGLVEATNNFRSINYAVSIDKESKYPNEFGNFILYAHSGSARISYFNNLKNVKLEDDIYVYFESQKYFYKVYKIYEIDKTGSMKILKPKNEKIITLVTCKTGTDKQIVVLGKQYNIEQY